MSSLAEYRDQYCDALDRYLGGSGEDALASAYEIGRRALADGVGILDFALLHHEAAVDLLRRHSPSEPAAFMAVVGSFFTEALSPFEMSYRAVAEANTALRHFNELLEDEAKRIAHALHDQAGTVLASAGLEFDLAVRGLPPAERDRLARVRHLLEETGQQLRHLSHELRPTILDDLGLGAALEFLAEGVEQRTGMRVIVRNRLHERIPAPAETAVYRVVQEAVNNTLLHGGAAPMVTVSLERRATSLRCVIADDGVGFDMNAVLCADARRGLGLIGMKERVGAIGGTCEIHSVPGEGTSIEISLALASPERSHG